MTMFTKCDQTFRFSMTKNVHATSPPVFHSPSDSSQYCGNDGGFIGPGLPLFQVFLARGHNSYAANMLNSGLFHCGVRIAALPQLYSVGVVTFTLSPDVAVSAAL